MSTHSASGNGQSAFPIPSPVPRSAGPRPILLIGFGNPGRLDDGLGPALAAAVEALAIPGVTVDSDYQLTVEHAELAARHAAVIFADAAAAGAAPFVFERVEPSAGEVEFSSHSVSPAGVLALARDLFGARPDGWLLALRGEAFDAFEERLTEFAQRNLAAALAFLEPRLRSGFPSLGKPGGESFQALEKASPRV